MPTRTIGTFNNGLVEFQIDYDASNRITAVRCINNGDTDVYGEVVQDVNGRKGGATFLAHTNTSISVPTGVAGRINISINAQGRLVGVTTFFRG